MILKRILTLLFFAALLQQTFAQNYLPQQADARLKQQPVIGLQAFAFPLSDVRLLPNGPFHHAMQMDSAYLMQVTPDRLLYRFRKFAGLAPKDSIYGGWESDGLSGHTMGHYLSAISMLYASTGSKILKQRIDYIVSELAACQKARGTGYVGAIPNEDTVFGRVARGVIRSSGFDLNGGWSPWYTVHKVFAGMLDAYLYAGNTQALQVAKGLGNWTIRTLSGLTNEQRLNMLNCEYGGMNEAMANLYAITGDTHYLEGSLWFYDEFVMGKLASGIDPMPGKHSNTNVPKAIGAARQYELTGAVREKRIASFFWETMVKHHSYVIGGNSNYEYCGEANKLSDRLSDATCETCNTYNMLKLTRHLFSWKPSAELGDYYERALYNHILASQDPKNGMMTYFVPLRMGARKSFSDSFNTFTCCVGSGMENHVKYNEGIYYEGEDGSLFVNLFIPSVLDWKKRNIKVSQTTRFPEQGVSAFTIRCAKAQTFTLKVRKPGWAKSRIQVSVNGKNIAISSDADGFLSITRNWKDGDRLDLEFQMSLHMESMPDNPDRIAILYGPLVLAGKLGKDMPDPVFGTPVIMVADKTKLDWVQQDTDKPLHFHWKGVGKPMDVEMAPFYSVSDEYYSVYWDFFTPDGWKQREAEYQSELKRQAEIRERTFDEFRIGEMQPERDHALKASNASYVSDAVGRMGREARKDNYFSFEMKTDPSAENILMLTYIGDDKDRKWDILIDGVKLVLAEWNGGQTGRFYDMEYPIPASMTQGKSIVTVRIEASQGRTAGRVFGCRILRPKRP
jgi:DUF1680 family protein